MSKIQAINKESVHRICSGQVVLNLATAVKELVENSLDAGATSVEVSLKDYGSELVEVSDNGGGVHPDNYEGLTLKHHTSKLQEFTDLTSVETFGFRGEALSSLCALSKVTITTKHKDSNVGHRLEFDHHGHIKNKTAVSRQVGTTVSLQGLFLTLPVRQKEFHRHLKKEFAKMTQVLYGYCLVALGVKLSCVNISKQGSRTTLVSTMGSSSLRENISCVFGPKQLQNIVSISQTSPDAAMLEEFKTPATEDNIFTLGGFISSAMHGHGRASTDRQFYFVNSRPCEPAKIVKLVNEVYHQFNSSQYPFIVLCIDVARACVDVNVTPDKRQLFLDHEKLLLATVKATLLKLFEYAPCTLPVNPLSLPAPSSSPSPAPDSVSPISLAMLNRWRHGSDKRKSGPVSEGQGKQKQMKLMDSFFSVTRDCPHEPNQDATDSIVKDPRVPNDDEGYESQQNRNAQNEKLSSTSLILNEDEDNNSMNITTIDPLNENIMSFDSDEDADNPTAQTSEETNEVSIEIKGENAIVLNDTTGINYLNNRTVSRLGDNVEENVNMSNSDVNTSSNSIYNYIPTPDNCDTIEAPYSPYQESNINHDCSSVQSSPNSSISNDYRIGRKSISTRTVNKLDMFKKTSTNTTNSSANAGSKSGLNFLDRLARFKSNSRNIVEINNPKPKEEPTEKVITILNRLTSDRYSPDLTEQNLRKSQTLVDIQNIDTVHADHAKFKVKKEVEDSEATNRVDEDNDGLEIKHESPKGGKENGSLLCDSSSKPHETEDQIEVINILDDMAPNTGNYRCTASIEFSVETMREKIQHKYERRISKAKAECLENKFHAEINPSKNKEAESELSRVISKSMFDQMIIVGQFNLGFIIVKYDKDLFIIDQHATDEKYNFETLQKTTVIKSQKLAVPQNLHLTKMNQCILKDHLNVFYKNGFEFSLDSSPEQDSVLLTSVPMSRSTTFGREDIDELLFMIQNTNNPELARPSRIRSMFASRACRKSVMIGKALSRGDMSTLVRHMGTIDQPWNCPHGRPTMRHLINLSLLVHNDASANKS